MSTNAFNILGISTQVSYSETLIEAKKAFKELSKKYHPDISKKQDCRIKFEEVVKAYKIVCDREKFYQLQNKDSLTTEPAELIQQIWTNIFENLKKEEINNV